MVSRESPTFFWLLIGLGLIASVSAGFFIGRSTSSGSSSAFAEETTGAVPTAPSKMPSQPASASEESETSKAPAAGDSLGLAEAVALADWDGIDTATSQRLIAWLNTADGPALESFYRALSSTGAASSAGYYGLERQNIHSVAAFAAARLAEIDPERLYELGTASENQSLQIQAINLYVEKLAARDIGAALAIAREIRQSHQRRMALMAVARQMSGIAPDRAEAAFDRLGLNGEERDAFRQALINRWAGDKPAEILAYARELPPGQERNQLFNRALSAIREEDPYAALKVFKEFSEDGQSQAWQLQQILKEIAEEDPVAAMALARDEEIPAGARNNAMSGVFRGWINRDADAALAWFDSLDGLENSGLKRQILRSLRHSRSNQERNYEALLQLKDEFPREHERSHYLRTLVQQWNRNDPEAARRYAAQLAGKERDEALRVLAAEVAKEDIGEAESMLRQIQDSDERLSAIRAIAGRLSHRSVDEARNWIGQLANAQERDEALAGLSVNLIHRNPSQSAAILAEIRDPEVRRQAERNFFNNLFRTDPAGAIDWAEHNLSQAGITELVKRQFWQISRETPEAAIELLDRLPPGSERTNLMKHAIGAIARNDPARALRLAEGMPEERARQDAIRDALRGWSQSDPKAALDYALGYEGPQRSGLVRTSMDQFVKMDADAAIAYARNIRDPAVRGTAQERIARALSHISPAEARAYVESFPVGEERSRLMRHAIDQYAKENPRGALAWVRDYPGTLANEDAFYKAIASRWMRSNSIEATTWVNELPDGKNRDAAIDSVVQDLLKTAPSDGFLWAEAIGDEDQRSQAVRQSLNAWRQINPAAAQEALDNSSLPAEEKARLREQWF